MLKLAEKTEANLKSAALPSDRQSEKVYIIPPSRTRYLSEISENNRKYDQWAFAQRKVAQKLYAIQQSIEALDSDSASAAVDALKKKFEQLKRDLDPKNLDVIEGWLDRLKSYHEPLFKYKVRDKEIAIKTHTESLS